jgi:hypothetical protein
MLPLKYAMGDENQSCPPFRIFCRRHFKDLPLKIKGERRRLVGYHVFEAEKGGSSDKRMKTVVVVRTQKQARYSITMKMIFACIRDQFLVSFGKCYFTAFLVLLKRDHAV